MRLRPTPRIVATGIVISLIIAACGDDPDDAAEPDAPVASSSEPSADGDDSTSGDDQIAGSDRDDSTTGDEQDDSTPDETDEETDDNEADDGAGQGGDGTGADDSTQPVEDDPELVALRTACAAGDAAACDDLYWLAEPGSEDERFGATCGGSGTANAGQCALLSEPSARGDNSFLDRLHDACGHGDLFVCDQLYWGAPVGSEYEQFAASCGDSDPGAPGGECFADDEPYGYGDHPMLDEFYDACTDGDGLACAQLWFVSPVASLYEEYGATCGNRFEMNEVDCEAELATS